MKLIVSAVATLALVLLIGYVAHVAIGAFRNLLSIIIGALGVS